MGQYSTYMVLHIWLWQRTWLGKGLPSLPCPQWLFISLHYGSLFSPLCQCKCWESLVGSLSSSWWNIISKEKKGKNILNNFCQRSFIISSLKYQRNILKHFLLCYNPVCTPSMDKEKSVFHKDHSANAFQMQAKICRIESLYGIQTVMFLCRWISIQ